MNLRLPLIVLVVSLTLAPLAGADLPTPEQRAAKAKEYAALRLKFAASDAYHPDDDVVSDLRVQCAEQMLAKEYGKVIELASGLAANDRVIESPSDGIANGDLVRVAAPDAKVAAPGAIGNGERGKN